MMWEAPTTMKVYFYHEYYTAYALDLDQTYIKKALLKRRAFKLLSLAYKSVSNACA